MAVALIHGSFVFGLVLLLVCSSVMLSSIANTRPFHFDVSSLNRSSFPEGFIFGTASSAYQVIIKTPGGISHQLLFELFYALIYFCFIPHGVWCVIFSMKALQEKVVEDQAFGFHLSRNLHHS